MNPGGGHEKNNPRLGKKSGLRGDKQREKKAGRKRIGREYRRKGSKETPLKKKKPVFKDFNEIEYNILYNLNKKKKYGKDSTNLINIIRARHVRPKKVMDVLHEFKEKLEERDWGEVYKGDDNNFYVNLNIEKKEIIESYIEINKP